MSIKAALQTLDGTWSLLPASNSIRYTSKAVLQQLKSTSRALSRPVWYIRLDNYTTALRLLLTSMSLVLMSMSKVKLWLQAWFMTSVMAAASEHYDSLWRGLLVALPVQCSKLLYWLKPIRFWSERCNKVQQSWS